MQNNTAQNQEVMMPEQAVEPYSEFRSQLSTLKDENAKTIFEYDDPRGNAAARSYCRKLSSTAVAIDKRRKDLGADARAYVDRVNKEGQALEAEVRAMIEPHKAAIDEIEAKEKERVSVLRARIDEINSYGNCAGHPLHELEAELRGLKTIEINASFAEFMADASVAYDTAHAALTTEIEVARKREAEAAELERLRVEAAERAEADRVAAIRKEAAEQAQKEAEQKAAKEKEAAEQRERDLQARAEQAEAAKQAEEAKREADKKHQAKIHAEIIAAMAAVGINEEAAKSCIVAIRKGDVPHVKITY